MVQQNSPNGRHCDPGLDPGEIIPLAVPVCFPGIASSFHSPQRRFFANIYSLYSLDRLQGKGFVSPAAAAPQESSLGPFSFSREILS
jgi:hypothetical protein